MLALLSRATYGGGRATKRLTADALLAIDRLDMVLRKTRGYRRHRYEAASLIQATYKCYRAYWSFQIEKAATLCIQIAYRSFSERKKAEVRKGGWVPLP